MMRPICLISVCLAFALAGCGGEDRASPLPAGPNAVAIAMKGMTFEPGQDLRVEGRQAWDGDVPLHLHDPPMRATLRVV